MIDLPKIIDLTNERFGKLVVIKKRGKDKHGHIEWLCKCDCGEETIATTSDLRRGHVKSCGCLGGKLKDLTGNKFGKLTVLKQYNNKNDTHSYWICQCECGNITKPIMGKDLTSGAIKSCGCFRKEKTKEMASERWKDEEYRTNHSGENHWNYNSDLTEEEREERASDRRNNSNFKRWSKKVKEQANYICDCCGKQGYNLHSHHLNGWNKFKEQRYDLENGVCLCESCHKEFHKLYGKGDNTKEQYIEFKEGKAKR